MGQQARKIARRSDAPKRPYEGSPGKRRKKLQAKVKKVQTYARWITSVLMQAAGHVVPSVLTVKGDAYHRSIQEGCNLLRMTERAR